MKKIILAVIAVMSLMLGGCVDASMQFKPQADLADKYDNSVSDDYLSVYYTVKDAPDGQLLMMTVKNTGNIFMKNLSFNYDDCCQAMHKGPGSYNYKNIGNLKNRASKQMTLPLPKGEIPSVKIDYSFTPVVEDAFLNRDAAYPADMSDITGTITIYLK